MVSHKNKFAGRLSFFKAAWMKVTNNPTVLSWIEGYKIPFHRLPPSTDSTQSRELSCDEKTALLAATKELLSLGAISICTSIPTQFISPIFLTDKSNGKKRFILNLKKLNTYVHTSHFKMEDYRTALRLVAPGTFMTTIDMKEAYLTIPVHQTHRKYLRFVLDGNLYEFTSVPFGLSSAPLCFTKLMKPIVSNLRQRGILCVNYLDDFLVLGESFQQCLNNTRTVMSTLESLGFVVNTEKSCLHPSTSQRFLGFIYNTNEMTLALTDTKKAIIKKWATHFRSKPRCKIREFAKFIGILVSACPAVKYGWLYTKSLEREKLLALARNEHNYDAPIVIPPSIQQDLLWWEQKILNSYNNIRNDEFEIEIFTDASLTGWGACCGTESTHGFWRDSEKESHINFLELCAVFHGLRCFANNLSNCDILLRCDNTTAISYINRMGSVKYPILFRLAKDIWQWCEHRNIWIFASYVSSADNYVADKESRQTHSEVEWELSQKAFDTIVDEFGHPDVDLFASYANTKCNAYVSWRRDPGSFAVDAFTLNWQKISFYAFPPFSLILRTLQKILRDKAEGIVVVPHWPSQPWYPLFSKLTVGRVLYFGPSRNLLLSPSSEIHPLAHQLTLVVTKLSGTRS